MKKSDLKKDFKALYTASAKEVVLVNVPRLRFLAVDGIGDPNTSQTYKEALEALFSVSYTAKFIVKKGPQQIDYAVMPLESLWWADDMSVFTTGDKAKWKWTAMIMQPDFATDKVVAMALADVRQKKKLPGVDRLRLETFAEGRCAQVLHIGPFSAEGPTIRRLHEYVDAQSQRTGKHHEIYLSDIRRAEPSRWKTIVRQPMK